jgi:hypothetical protein
MTNPTPAKSNPQHPICTKINKFFTAQPLLVTAKPTHSSFYLQSQNTAKLLELELLNIDRFVDLN